jgi:hypothetical protein
VRQGSKPGKQANQLRSRSTGAREAMHWIASSENETKYSTLEKRPGDGANTATRARES